MQYCKCIQVKQQYTNARFFFVLFLFFGLTIKKKLKNSRIKTKLVVGVPYICLVVEEKKKDV